MEIRFNSCEELQQEIDRVIKGYKNEHGQGYPNQLFYINWIDNIIYYKDGDPLKISLRHTSQYDY